VNRPVTLQQEGSRRKAKNDVLEKIPADGLPHDEYIVASGRTERGEEKCGAR
jgi:hypothetical protein